LELTILGSGRSTPTSARVCVVSALVSGAYLPAIYREDPGPASFLERWLANFEGFFTNLEDRIEHVHALFDPRTAPAEALDWLGCWMGVVLDPMWAEDRRRFFIRHAHELYRWRGTVRGLEMALRIYPAETLDEQVLDPRGAAELRIVEQFVTRQENASSPVNTAHRFKVLIPHDLPEDQAHMVERIVDLERPGHASYEVKRYWDMFRVGEARVGLDTQVGHGSSDAGAWEGGPGSYLEACIP
jgi:phage tail-like protein